MEIKVRSHTYSKCELHKAQDDVERQFGLAAVGTNRSYGL